MGRTRAYCCGQMYGSWLLLEVTQDPSEEFGAQGVMICLIPYRELPGFVENTQEEARQKQRGQQGSSCNNQGDSSLEVRWMVRNGHITYFEVRLM